MPWGLLPAASSQASFARDQVAEKKIWDILTRKEKKEEFFDSYCYG
jgi:hypothetical protein